MNHINISHMKVMAIKGKKTMPPSKNVGIYSFLAGSETISQQIYIYYVMTYIFHTFSFSCSTVSHSQPVDSASVLFQRSWTFQIFQFLYGILSHFSREFLSWNWLRWKIFTICWEHQIWMHEFKSFFDCFLKRKNHKYPWASTSKKK